MSNRLPGPAAAELPPERPLQHPEARAKLVTPSDSESWGRGEAASGGGVAARLDSSSREPLPHVQPPTLGDTWRFPDLNLKLGTTRWRSC